MHLSEKRSAAFVQARNSLKGILAYQEKSQRWLARQMNMSSSNLNHRLKSDKIEIWEDVARHYEPALRIVAQLLLDIAAAYAEKKNSTLTEAGRKIDSMLADLQRDLDNQLAGDDDGE